MTISIRKRYIKETQENANRIIEDPLTNEYYEVIDSILFTLEGRKLSKLLTPSPYPY